MEAFVVVAAAWIPDWGGSLTVDPVAGGFSFDCEASASSSWTGPAEACFCEGWVRWRLEPLGHQILAPAA